MNEININNVIVSEPVFKAIDRDMEWIRKTLYRAYNQNENLPDIVNKLPDIFDSIDGKTEQLEEKLDMIKRNALSDSQHIQRRPQIRQRILDRNPFETYPSIPTEINKLLDKLDDYYNQINDESYNIYFWDVSAESFKPLLIEIHKAYEAFYDKRLRKFRPELSDKKIYVININEHTFYYTDTSTLIYYEKDDVPMLTDILRGKRRVSYDSEGNFNAYHADEKMAPLAIKNSIFLNPDYADKLNYLPGTWHICRKCGVLYFMPQPEIDWHKEKQLSIPNHCYDCRYIARKFKKYKEEYCDDSDFGTIGFDLFEHEEYKIATLIIPDYIKRIKPRVFQDCINLRFVRIDSHNLKVIEEGVFADNRSLKTIELSDGLEVIEKFAFSNCVCLESIKIPDTCKKIEACAFANCKKLRKIIVPIDCEIDANAFAHCNPDNTDNIEIIRKG